MDWDTNGRTCRNAYVSPGLLIPIPHTILFLSITFNKAKCYRRLVTQWCKKITTRKVHGPGEARSGRQCVSKIHES